MIKLHDFMNEFDEECIFRLCKKNPDLKSLIPKINLLVSLIERKQLLICLNEILKIHDKKLSKASKLALIYWLIGTFCLDEYKFVSTLNN